MFLKGRQVSRFGCFVFEIWVLSASLFIFEYFVFKTTINLGTELGLPLDVTNITHRARGSTSLKINTLTGILKIYLPPDRVGILYK